MVLSVTKKHGGKRPGAGRKPSGRTKRRGPFMLSPEAAGWLDRQNNKSLVVDLLIRAVMGQTLADDLAGLGFELVVRKKGED